MIVGNQTPVMKCQGNVSSSQTVIFLITTRNLGPPFLGTDAEFQINCFRQRSYNPWQGKKTHILKSKHIPWQPGLQWNISTSLVL